MGINDLDGGADQPSYAHIAVCVGSDVDGDPVTIVDRLCLNNAAARSVGDGLEYAYEQNEELKSALIESKQENAKQESNIKSLCVYGLIELVAIIVLVLVIGSGLKRVQ